MTNVYIGNKEETTRRKVFRDLGVKPMDKRLNSTYNIALQILKLRIMFNRIMVINCFLNKVSRIKHQGTTHGNRNRVKP